MSVQLTEDFLKSMRGGQAQLEEMSDAVTRGEIHSILIQDDKLFICFNWLARGQDGRWTLTAIRNVSFSTTNLRVHELEQGWVELRTLTRDRIIIFPPRSKNLLDPSYVEGLIPF